MGQTWLAEPDVDGEKACALRPLQAAAIPCRLRLSSGQALRQAQTVHWTVQFVSGLSITHLVISPLEFLHRLAALVPRPSPHLVRFHTVLAPILNAMARTGQKLEA